MNMRKLKFNSVAERMAYKKREAEKIKRQRDLVDESDRSISMLACYCLPTLLISLITLIAVLMITGGHNEKRNNAGANIISETQAH